MLTHFVAETFSTCPQGPSCGPSFVGGQACPPSFGSVTLRVRSRGPLPQLTDLQSQSPGLAVRICHTAILVQALKQIEREKGTDLLCLILDMSID